jgi:hypothetical protein
MKILAAICSMSLFVLTPAHASVSVKNGKVTISVSGADGSGWGDNGSSAGESDVTLSYADAAKTIVKITGTNTHYKKTETINEQIALKDLKEISIYAIGGDGASGYDGSSGSSGSYGSDGYPGSNGSDGCPPGSGGQGGNGGDGGNGSDGSSGGNGGHGGAGGAIKVNTSPDQNELMLYVKTYVGGGGGGRGGSGGMGGSGGRGGNGGMGGRGGTNTCTDDKGNRTGGPDGSNGWNGSSGRDGSPGRNGSDGYSGRGGRSGSRAFNLVANGAVQTYAAPFDLKVTTAKFLDDTGDSILEPGERAYLSALVVTNKGPMPSPAGQTIVFKFLNSTTLVAPAVLTASIPPIAPGANYTASFKKGALALEVPDVNALIGKKAVAEARLNINNVALAYDLDSGMSVHWPVSMTASAGKLSTFFEVEKALSFTLKNVGSAPLGPNGSQPVYFQVAWSSKTIPGSDVAFTLADGRSFVLDKPVQISDLTVPANGTLPLPINMVIHDSKLLQNGSGTLKVSLRLQDMSSGSEDLVQSQDVAINTSLDMSQLVWTQTVNLAGAKVQCLFAGLPNPGQPIASFQVTKAKASNQVKVQVAVPGSGPGSVSPVIAFSASHVLPYYEKFNTKWTAQDAADFLNKMVSPNAPKGSWGFKGCTVSL